MHRERTRSRHIPRPVKPVPTRGPQTAVGGANRVGGASEPVRNRSHAKDRRCRETGSEPRALGIGMQSKARAPNCWEALASVKSLRLYPAATDEPRCVYLAALTAPTCKSLPQLHTNNFFFFFLSCFFATLIALIQSLNVCCSVCVCVCVCRVCRVCVSWEKRPRH